MCKAGPSPVLGTEKQPLEELSYQGHNRTFSGEVFSTEKGADKSVDTLQFRVMQKVVRCKYFVLKREKRQYKYPLKENT